MLMPMSWLSNPANGGTRSHNILRGDVPVGKSPTILPLLLCGRDTR